MKRLCCVLAGVLAGACGGGGGSGGGQPAATVDDCSIESQNRFVDDVMRDIYLWVEELPAIVPEALASPEDVLDVLRFEPLDRFSSIRDEAAESSFFSASQFIGVGLGLQTTDEDRVFVTQVFGDGPAAAAGFMRGDELLAINGADIPGILAGEGISAAFGADEIGLPVTLRWLDRDGTETEVTIQKDLVTIETVPVAQFLQAGGRPVGYVAFRDFVEPAFDALESAFAELQRQGVEELVLDLRYNGGGLLSVAETLADLIGGMTTQGQVFYHREHNSRNRDLDVTAIFADRANAVDLQRLVVIATGATASASELVINGLRPFVDVVMVGETTFGKPVGSFGYTFCGKVLQPISFRLINADGVTDYFGGFAPDCAAADDLTRALGDPDEAMLAEALHYLENGACSPVAVVQQYQRAAVRKQRVPPAYGFRELLGGAY